MIGKLNHVAIAVQNIEAASEIYSGIFGASISQPVDQPEHGVKVVFINLLNTKIELISPLGVNSPIEKFLQKNKNGGMHHICYEVKNIETAMGTLLEKGLRLLGQGKPKIGAHGKPVIFLHPTDFSGVLIELQEE